MRIRTLTHAVVLAAAMSGAALAQSTSVTFDGLKADASLPIEVNSNSLEVNQTDGSAVFSGDAIVTQGELKLSATTLRAEYSEETKTINKIIASGDVLLVNAADAVQADSAVYDVGSSEVILTGNVLMTQGAAAISAQKMVIDLKTGTGRMEGRVTTTFVPGKNK